MYFYVIFVLNADFSVFLQRILTKGTACGRVKVGADSSASISSTVLNLWRKMCENVYFMLEESFSGESEYGR
jgi:hypothetical protein